MIIDLPAFIAEGRTQWDELETFLNRLERNRSFRMNVNEAERFHYLYQRASADLSRIATFSAEREIRRYLETLVARAYGEIHASRQKAHHLSPLRWAFGTFPRAFRRRVRAFALALAFLLVGGAFGGLAVTLDPAAKEVIAPFPHLLGDPAKRVELEESQAGDTRERKRITFSAWLMQHNTRVSILALALGMTFGVGTGIMLFYNGTVLGAVAADYVLAGEGRFLAGWLLPHGVVEIPAMLIAAQAGLVLAGALIGWGRPTPMGARLREVSGDLATLISGAALLLVYAGVVEAFLSQHHEPAISYTAKIVFGVVELAALVLFLSVSGRERAV